MLKIVDRKVNGFYQLELQISREIREFARPLVTLARRIVVALREAAGVSEVAYGDWFGRSRSPERLIASMRPDGSCAGHVLVHATVDPPSAMANIMAQHVGKCGDVPTSRILPLIEEMQHVRAVYPCVYHGKIEPADWQVPHVWPGAYFKPEMHPWGKHYFTDVVSGIDWNPANKRVRDIWDTAPLARYAIERFCIPFDVIVQNEFSEKRGFVAYRRFGHNVYLLFAPELGDGDTLETTHRGIGLVYNVIGIFGFDLQIRNIMDYQPNMDLPVA